MLSIALPSNPLVSLLTVAVLQSACYLCSILICLKLLQVRLTVLVQVITWKDSSLKSPIMYWVTHKHIVIQDCSVTPECSRVTARLLRSAGGVLLYLWSCSSHLFRGRPGHCLQLISGRRPRVALLGLVGVSSGSLTTFQTVSCNDGQLDPAQDRDLSERKRLCSTYGPVNGSWLYGVGI